MFSADICYFNSPEGLIEFNNVILKVFESEYFYI